jgi:3-oxoacyl-[acyl-carrier protein] reductase
VVAVDLRSAAETSRSITEAGGTCKDLVADVAHGAAVQHLADEVANEYGPCQVLVNNAALQLPPAPFAEVGFETWRRVLSVNLDSMFLTCKAFLPAMVAARWGRIVNVASTSVFTSTPGLTPYMASKGGVVGFTSGLANDVGGYGITVNAVSPALTRTPAVDEAIAAGGFPPEMLEVVASLQSIKRPGAPDNVVGLVAFLASDDADFITGQFIAADGGLTRR